MNGFYKAGDRVKMSCKALEQGFDHGNRKYKRTTTGTVVSDQESSLITVQRDGRHCAHTYHAIFWVLDPNADKA